MLWYEKTTVSSYSNLSICHFTTVQILSLPLHHSGLQQSGQTNSSTNSHQVGGFISSLSLTRFISPSLSLSLSPSSYSPRAFFPSIKNQIFSFHRLAWIASFLQPGSIRIHPLHNQEVVTEDWTLSHWAWERGSEREREREREREC